MQSISKADNFLQVKEEDYESVLVKCGVTDRIALDSIASIKEWYKMQLHFPNEIFSDSQFFSILLANNFSLERTKEKLDNLLTARSLLPEVISDRDPHTENMQSVFQYISSAIIPKRLDDMTRIIISGFKCEDPSKFNYGDYINVLGCINEYLAFSDVSLGYHCIVDWKGLKTGHVAKTNPVSIKDSLFIFTDCYGSKIKSLHFINVPEYAKWIFSAVKMCLSNKMSSRVHAHVNPGDLLNFFPKSLLPSDFGGDNKSMEEFTKDVMKKMDERRDDILKLNRMKSDESKRVGVGSAMSKELQGMQGSFRTLDID